MDVDHNKAMVRLYVDRLNAKDVDGLGQLFSETFTWVLPVRASALRELAQPRNKRESYDRCKAIFDHMREGPGMEIVALTAEGDRVAAELTSHVVWDNGKPMDNLYHHAFVFKDGKIDRVTEYLDFTYVLETSPLAAQSSGA